MLQYVNGFSCAIDSEKEDVILNFVQRSPVIDEEGIQEETQVETVSSLIMGKAVAERLLEALEELLTSEAEENIKKG